MSNKELYEYLVKHPDKKLAGEGMCFYAYDEEFGALALYRPLDEHAEMWDKIYMDEDDFLTRDISKCVLV